MRKVSRSGESNLRPSAYQLKFIIIIIIIIITSRAPCH